jgi:hypothetical protein
LDNFLEIAAVSFLDIAAADAGTSAAGASVSAEVGRRGSGGKNGDGENEDLHFD